MDRIVIDTEGQVLKLAAPRRFPAMAYHSYCPLGPVYEAGLAGHVPAEPLECGHDWMLWGTSSASRIKAGKVLRLIPGIA